MSAPPDPHDETPLPSQGTRVPEEWLDLVDAPPGNPSAAGAGDAERLENGSADERDALRRARSHARALRDLPRLSAPRALDGSVVAALHAGHREDRAARHVASLTPLPAPPSLAWRVEREFVSAFEGAPVALDRLVEARVAAEALPGRGAGRAPSVRQRLLTATAAGIALGMLLGLGGVLWSLAGAGAGVTGSGGADPVASANADGATAETGSFVEFIEVDIDDLSPADRALLSHLGGPLLGGRS